MVSWLWAAGYVDCESVILIHTMIPCCWAIQRNMGVLFAKGGCGADCKMNITGDLVNKIKIIRSACRTAFRSSGFRCTEYGMAGRRPVWPAP